MTRKHDDIGGFANVYQAGTNMLYYQHLSCNTLLNALSHGHKN